MPIETGRLNRDTDKANPNNHSLDLMDDDTIKAFSFVASCVSRAEKVSGKLYIFALQSSSGLHVSGALVVVS